MTFDERAAALAQLGLPPRQTAFLATVALHGGYCLRRHFDVFTGCKRTGMVGRNLFAALIDRDLATPIRYRRDAGFIYHLHAKSLYRAIDQDDNRNRRVVSPALIARKLMVLDHVLTVPPSEWLATEQDKVTWFTTHVGIRLEDLPQRRYPARHSGQAGTTRYFIHKMPIRIEPAGERVHFVHLVEDDSGRHCEAFLADHLRLLTRLPAWTLVLVYPPHLRYGAGRCEQVFARGFVNPAAVASLVGRDELAWFFRTRAAVERDDFRSLSVADIDRFRDLRPRLATAAIERRYVEWQRLGDSVLAEPARIDRPFEERARLVRHELPWRYHQFGRLPGAA